MNQFGDEQEQRVAKATAEMLQRLENEPDWKLFAVVDGKEEPLTEAEVFHIFQDEAAES